MKRNLLLLAVMVIAALFFATNSWAQTNDLGAPDSVIIKTLGCDHTYEQGPNGYDEVRVEIYVSHDSNTFYWEAHDPPIFIQDSIQAMIIPMKFWHQPDGCADSVVLPNWLVPGQPEEPGDIKYNNTESSGDYLPYSIFRDIYCGTNLQFTHRMKALNWSSRILDIADNHSCTGDSGYAWLSLIAQTKKKWAQGSMVPLAALTFWVYMNCDVCDTTEIAIDTMTTPPPPASLLFVRMDAAPYVPWFSPFPVKDTIYCVPCLPPGIVCPTAENQTCSGTYTSLTPFTATDPNVPTLNITSVVATAPVGTGITAASVVYLPGDTPPPAQTVIGHVQYTVDHCATGNGGAITLTATNGCEPPLSAQCSFNVTYPTNQPPTVDCPDDVSGPYDVTLVSGDFTAGDECLPPTVTWDYAPHVPAVHNAPQRVGDHFTWDAFCTETITITVTVTDDCGLQDNCSFTMTGENTAPEVTQFALPTSISSGNSVTDAAFNYTDDEGGVVAAGGYASCGTISVNFAAKKFTYDAPDVTEPTICNVCIWVEDECGLRDTLCKDINITTEPLNQVKIPNKVYERFGFHHWDYMFPQDPEADDNCIMFDEACPGWWGINPGDFFEIPIILRNFQLPIGGFELEVDFDYIDLTFYGADRGGLLQGRYTVGGVFYSWEYFSYRVLPCPTCACCKYKILLYGQAEMPDGDLRIGYTIDPTFVSPEETPGLFWYNDKIRDDCPQGAVIDSFATLAWLKFQVANNELLRDLKLPIVFEWEQKLDPDEMVVIQDWDCAENTMTNASGGVLFVSIDDDIQYSDKCPAGDSIFPILYFVNGGVHICSPCTAFTCVRGDINMDEVPYSTADAVLFANYFVHGLGVFTIDRDAQVCATDINADGRTLMLADLIYLIRVIQRDAIAFPKLGPSSDVVNLIVSDGRITVECASAIGGILFKFDGNVTPTLLNANMELLSNESNVLVWSGAGHSINAGASQLLTASGAKLVSVIAVDREGRDLATTITTKVAPSTFTLHPAYPNPFNPNTNLSFSLPTAVSYSLNIYNVAGQLVRSYEGMGNVGLNVITWDGKDNAGNNISSGVYFYKLTAGSYTATNKMVMMK